MSYCINTSLEEFKTLQKETKLHPDILKAKISVWLQDKVSEAANEEEVNNILSSFPTKEELGFQKLKIDDVFTPDEIDDLVQGYVYYLTQDISPEKEILNLNKRDALGKLLKKIKSNGNGVLANAIIEEKFFEDIVNKGDDVIKSFGIKINKEFNDDIEEENEDGGIDIKESYERDPSSIANSDLLMFLSLIPKFKKSYRNRSVLDKSELTGIPKFENSNVVKNTLYSILSNTVTDSYAEDGFDLMVKKLEEYASKNPTIKFILNKLIERSSKFQTNFYQVFNNADLELFSVLIKELENYNEVSVKSSLIQTDESFIVDKWVSEHSVKLTKFENGSYIYNKEKIADINKLHNLINIELSKKSLSNTELESLKKNVLDYFDFIGLPITENQYFEVLNYFSKINKSNIKNSTNDEFTLKALNNLFLNKEGLMHIAGKFLLMEKNNKYVLNYNEKLDKYDNVLEDQKFVKKLASIINNIENVTSSPIILGAKGKKYWNKIKFNHLTKTIQKWKNNKNILQAFINKSIWAKNSIIAKQILEGKDIKISVFNNLKEIGKNDEGEKVTNLKESELLVSHFNMTLQGKMVGLAEADKSMQYVIDNVDTIIVDGIELVDGKIKLKSENNEVVNILMEYLADELNRIRQTYDDLYDANNNSIKPEQEIMYLHTQENGLNSYLFPELTQKYTIEDETGKTKENNLLIDFGLANSFGKPLPINPEYYNNTALKTFIKESFENALNEDIEILKSNMVIKEVKENDKVISYESDFLPTIKNQSNFTSFNQMLATFTFNSIVGSVEMSKLFLGDPAAFKSKKMNLFSDITKRIPLITASGNIPRIYEDKSVNVKVNPTYKSATTNSAEGPSRFYFNEDGSVNEELVNNMLEASNSILPENRQIAKSLFIKSLNGYKKNNKADAQSWITLDLWKQRWASYKGWDLELEKSFQRLKNNEFTFDDLQLVLQPIKTVTVELKVNDNGQTYPIYHKMSEAVLPDFLFKDVKLSNILNIMTSNNVDQLVTLDANKTGGVNINNLFDETGQPVEDIKLNTVEIETTSTILQLDMPLKGLKSTLIGSQLTKNVLAAVIAQADYVSPVTGKSIKGSELILEYHRIIASLSDENLLKLSQELGIDSVSKGLINKDKFFMFIVDKLKDDLTEGQIELLLKHKNINVIPGFTSKIENTINKAIKKSTVSLKQKGGSGILMSGVGVISMEAKLTSQDIKNGIIWLKSDLTKGLSPTTVSKKGNTFKTNKAQILIGHKEIRKILKEDIANLTNEEIISKIDPRVLQGIMYRIPNQSLASNDAFEIVGILPDYMGDTIIAFDEITTKTGSDFDIDKAYYILPNLEVNEEGVITLPLAPNEMTDEQAYQTKLKKDWLNLPRAKEVILQIENRELVLKEKKYYIRELKKFKDEVEVLLEDKNILISELNENNTTLNELDNQIKQIIKSNIKSTNAEIAKAFENIKNYNEALTELRQNILDEAIEILLDEGVVPSFKEFKEYDFYSKATKDVLENKRLEYLNSFLSDPRHIARVVNPIDSDVLKDMINDLHGEEEASSLNNLNFWKGTTQLKNKLMFDMAKSMVGIIANAVSDHNLSIHETLSYFNVFFGKGVASKAGNLVSAIINEDDVEVSSILNDFMNAIVDAAKDPFIVRGNVNLFTANTVFMMLRSGISLDYVMAFIGQPVLKELTKLKATREGRVADALYENGIFIKPEDELRNKLIDSLSESDLEQYYNIKSSVRLDSFNTEALKKAIKNHRILGKGNNLNQLLILELFVNLISVSKLTNKSLKASKQDVDGPGKTFIESYLKEQEIKNLISSEAITNFNVKLGLNLTEDNELVEMDNRKMIGAYYTNSTKVVNGFSSQVSLSSSQSFKDLLEIIRSSQIGNIYENQDIVEFFQKEFLSLAFNYSESALSLEQDKIMKLFKGENSLAKRLIKFTSENKDFTLNNPLLKSLGTKLKNINNPVDLITFNKNNSYSEKELKKAWEELDNHSKEGNLISKDLLFYSFYSNSFNNGLYTFHEFMPDYFVDMFDISKTIINSTNLLNNVGFTELNNVLEQIVRNNIDSKFIRRIPSNSKNARFIKSINNIPTELAFEIFNEDFINTFKIGNNENIITNSRSEVFPTYVTRKAKGAKNKLILYKFAGISKNNLPVYTTISNLGVNGTGFNIKEYGSSIKKVSSFEVENTNPSVIGLKYSFNDKIKSLKESLKKHDNFMPVNESVTRRKISEQELDDLNNNC